MTEDELKNALKLQQQEITTLSGEVAQLRKIVSDGFHDELKKYIDDRVLRLSNASQKDFGNIGNSIGTICHRLDELEHSRKAMAKQFKGEYALCDAIESLRNRVVLLEQDDKTAKFIASQKKFNSNQLKINKAKVEAFERLDAAVSDIEASLRGDYPSESSGECHEDRLLSWLCEPQVANPERVSQ